MSRVATARRQERRSVIAPVANQLIAGARSPRRGRSLPRSAEVAGQIIDLALVEPDSAAAHADLDAHLGAGDPLALEHHLSAGGAIDGGAGLALVAGMGVDAAEEVGDHRGVDAVAALPGDIFGAGHLAGVEPDAAARGAAVDLQGGRVLFVDERGAAPVRGGALAVEAILGGGDAAGAVHGASVSSRCRGRRRAVSMLRATAIFMPWGRLC